MFKFIMLIMNTLLSFIFNEEGERHTCLWWTLTIRVLRCRLPKWRHVRVGFHLNGIPDTTRKQNVDELSTTNHQTICGGYFSSLKRVMSGYAICWQDLACCFMSRGMVAHMGINAFGRQCRAAWIHIWSSISHSYQLPRKKVPDTRQHHRTYHV